MSSFDTTLRVGEASVQVVENEDGRAYEAQLVLGTITVLPVSKDQVIPVPIGIYRISFDKKTIGGLIEQLQKAKDVLVERIHIETASSLAGVDQAANFQSNLRG